MWEWPPVAPIARSVILPDGTILTFGAIADGEVLQRVGSEIVGVSAAPFVAAYHDCFSTAAVTYDSVTWEAVTNVLTLTANLAVGITRVASDFTFDAAGTYEWDCKAQVIAATTTQIGFRLRDVAGAITKANTTGTTNGAASGTMTCPALFTVAAGQTLALEYCKPLAVAAVVAAGVFDGDPIQNFRSTLRRVA